MKIHTDLQALWKQLRLEGFDILPSWIDEAELGATADLGELWERIAKEIASADGLVLYIEAEDFPLEGALIEVGIALGLGKAIHIVLPDLEPSAPSYRPVGSWIMHPNVVRFKNVRQACKARFVAGAASSLEVQHPSCTVCGKPMKLERSFRCECGSSSGLSGPSLEATPPTGTVLRRADADEEIAMALAARTQEIIAKLREAANHCPGEYRMVRSALKEAAGEIERQYGSTK
jgi:hypothetical protein